MATYTVVKKTGPETFETDLTLPQAIGLVERKYVGNNFAQSMLESARSEKGLSPKQLAWVMKLAHDTQSAPGPLLPLVTAVTKWQEGVKGRVVLNLVGVTIKAAHGGRLYLYSPGGEYRGMVTAKGELRGPQDVLPALLAASADPGKAAREYGKETGKCGCCRRKLSDPVSVFGGIGPICLERLMGAGARKELELEYKMGLIGLG